MCGTQTDEHQHSIADALDGPATEIPRSGLVQRVKCY